MKRPILAGRTLAVWALAVLGMACWLGSPAWGQKVRRAAPGGFPNAMPAAVDANGQDPDALLDGVFLPPDRTAKRRLEQAREILQSAKPDYSESVKVLGTLLESSEDYFFRPDASRQEYRSLKAEAGRLIAQMPKEGQAVYELTFGATARRALEEAAAAGDLAKVSDVSRRFFYTEAGWEATVLVARDHLDHGSPLAAALSFQRLLSIPAATKRLEPMLSLSLAMCWARAGMPDKAKEVLAALKKTNPDAQVRRGEGATSAFSGEGLAMLMDEARRPGGNGPAMSQWSMFRGDPGRNAASAGSGPLLSPRWQQRAFDDRATESRIAQLRQSYLDQDIVALPCSHPLAIGNTVLMRRPTGLWGVDFATGKVKWEYRDDSFRKLEDAARSNPRLMVTAIDQRTWDDSTFGTMSSDGECVYYVDNLIPRNIGLQAGIVQINVNGRRRMDFGPRTANCLVARELARQGALHWYVGTDARGDEGGAEPKLANAFFLGPPLPLLGNLYVLAETQGQEIRLVVLSAKDGHMEWSQQLAVVDQESPDAGRSASGATPSFADGVLICPTAAGAVVAVDLATRSLLWGYTYAAPNSSAAQDRLAAVRMARGLDFGVEQRYEHWADTSATIADGRVLVTPIESDSLYCLDLLSGRAQWKQERGNGLYVACVHEGKVILVGHKRVSAFKLSDGTPAWSAALELPPGSMPSGRGYRNGKYYYLPLSTAEVAKIDLDEGRIEARARSRHGEIPGNLICFRGEVVSQGISRLETFYQLESLKLEVAETLKKDPDRPAALAQLGQIKLDEGKLHEAIGLFRRAYELDHGNTSRDLLVESLLEGLRGDFAGSRQAAQELESLIDRKPQQTKFLRYMAMGLQQSGDMLAAFQTYIRLLDLEPLRAELDEANESLLVRRDRWIQGQLTLLRNSAGLADQRQIDAVVEARLQAALKAPPENNEQVKALRAFLHLFATHPAADEAREQLVTRLSGKDTLLEREQLLRRLETSADEARGRRATARLALLFDEAGRAEFAAMYYRKLLERSKDKPCLDGMSGQELVDRITEKNPARKLVAGQKPWPLQFAGHSDGTPVRPSGLARQRLIDIDVQGKRDPFFDEVTVALDGGQRMIVGRDGVGRERFRVSLTPANQRMAFAYNGMNGANSAFNYVSVNGNLMLLSLGYQLLAIDTLRTAADNSNRVLWSQDMIDPASVHLIRMGLHPRPLDVPWGPPRLIPNDAAGHPIGATGPVNDGGVCFQRLRELYSVNPLTGETIWVRKNVPAGSDLFGDEELLFVVPPDGTPALVLSAINGELLGRRTIPPLDQRMATVGRYVLVWTTVDGEAVVSLQDPWQPDDKQTVWSRKFASGSKGCVVSQEAVGVLEPSGAFALLHLPDGKPIVEEELEPEKALSSIYLLRSAEQYLLMTNSPPEKQPLTFAPAPGGTNDPPISGRLYAFNRATGKKMWRKPTFIDQYGLVLTQPCELPVLAFMRVVGGTKTSVLCVDKRSGDILYHNDDMRVMINSYEFVADRDKSTVSLHLPGAAIVLRFTREPIEPSTWIEGLQKAIRGEVLGRGAPVSADDPHAQAVPRRSSKALGARGRNGELKQQAKIAGKPAPGQPPAAGKTKADAEASESDPFGDADSDVDSDADDDAEPAAEGKQPAAEQDPFGE